MLTPQEVTGFTFEKALLGGYDTASVDKFMNQLTQDYTALYRDNSVLKNKMKVLVDKVEEYRTTEDSMHMALLQAEKTAAEIIESAEARRDSIEAETRQQRADLMALIQEEAESRRSQIREELAAEEAALLNAKKAVNAYLDKLKTAMSEYSGALEHIYDFVEPLPPEPEAPPHPAEEAAAPAPAEEAEAAQATGVTQDTVENIAEIIKRAISSADETEKPADDEPTAEFVKTKLPRIDYDNLQFGSNYNPSSK